MTSEIVHTTVVDRRELFALGLRDARVPRPLDRRHTSLPARAPAQASEKELYDAVVAKVVNSLTPPPPPPP